jgi:hypothetical protein
LASSTPATSSKVTSGLGSSETLALDLLIPKMGPNTYQ